jgi:predicted RNA-binding protein with PUA-like domain
MALVKNTRLSVQPVTGQQFNKILQLAATKV